MARVARLCDLLGARRVVEEAAVVDALRRLAGPAEGEPLRRRGAAPRGTGAAVSAARGLPSRRSKRARERHRTNARGSPRRRGRCGCRRGCLWVHLEQLSVDPAVRRGEELHDCLWGRLAVEAADPNLHSLLPLVRVAQEVRAAVPVALDQHPVLPLRGIPHQPSVESATSATPENGPGRRRSREAGSAARAGESAPRLGQGLGLGPDVPLGGERPLAHDLARVRPEDHQAHPEVPEVGVVVPAGERRGGARQRPGCRRLSE